MPSRAKRRKLEFAASTAKTTHEKVADVTYAEFYKALTQLGGIVKQRHDDLRILADNLAEVSLRVRYVMQHFKFQKGSAMLGFDGRPIAGEIATLFDRYTVERERFLAALSQETAHDVTSTDSHDGAKDAGATRAPAAGRGDDSSGRGDATVAAASGPRLVQTA